MIEEKVVRLVSERGVLTGAQISGAVNEDSLLLWRACKRSGKLAVRRTGKRYLRLDRRVEGYVRLSPSILREFLTYSVIGLAADPGAIEQSARSILLHIKEVSRQKLELARRIVSEVQQSIGDQWPQQAEVCFIIAGDVVYEMAHDVLRPERSTGTLVRGSDIDMVVIVGDDCPDDFIERIDNVIYGIKYRLLTSPAFKEEIDYTIKRPAKVREQLSFDTFRHMVACKILDEGCFIGGSEGLFRSIKAMLGTHGVTARLKELEQKAREFRDGAEEYLLATDYDKLKKGNLSLFYPAEEWEEFE